MIPDDEQFDRPRDVDEETASVAFPDINALKGKRLAEFRIVREIGRGSMGVVFEAVQESLDRRVALKVLPPTINLPEKSIRRFLREAESVAKLQHECIVQIYAIGKKDSLYYYAMQYVDGRPLDEVLKEEHPLSFERTAHLMRQTAEAVHYAHQHGIIHRDIKPGNILVTSGYKVVITDFGLARQERAATLTESGALVGTPIYMSPEQVLGRKGTIGKSADIYSLGVTLYELLTAKPPFSGETTQEILSDILEQDPKPPRKIRPSVPWELDVIALKAMEKEPQKRFATAGEMADDLQRFLDGEPILARPTGMLTKLIKKIRKNRVTAGIAAVALVLVLWFIINSAGLRDLRDLQRNTEAYNTAMQEGQDLLNDVNQSNADKAVEKFREAVALFPDRAEGHHYLGRAFSQNNELDKALDEFNLAIVCDPEFSAAFLERSRVHLRMGMIIEGMEDLMRVRALEPGSFSFAYDCTVMLFNCYIEYSRSRERSEAEQKRLLEVAIQCAVEGLEYGNSADMRCLLGMIYYEMAKLFTGMSYESNEYLARALEEIENAISQDRNHKTAFDFKEEIEDALAQTRAGRRWIGIDLYEFARDQGYDEKWAISEGTELVEPVWDFLKDNVFPAFDPNFKVETPAEGKEPDF